MVLLAEHAGQTHVRFLHGKLTNISNRGLHKQQPEEGITRRTCWSVMLPILLRQSTHVTV